MLEPIELPDEYYILHTSVGKLLISSEVAKEVEAFLKNHDRPEEINKTTWIEDLNGSAIMITSGTIHLLIQSTAETRKQQFQIMKALDDEELGW